MFTPAIIIIHLNVAWLSMIRFDIITSVLQLKGREWTTRYESGDRKTTQEAVREKNGLHYKVEGIKRIG